MKKHHGFSALSRPQISGKEGKQVQITKETPGTPKNKEKKDREGNVFALSTILFEIIAF